MSEKSSKKFYQTGWFYGILAVIVIIIVASNSQQPQKIAPVTSTVTATTTSITANSSQDTASVQTSNSTPQTFKIGDSIQQDDYILTVNSVNTCTPSNEFMTPQSGDKFIVLDVTEQGNGTDSTTSYNDLNFKIQDDKGFTYTNSFESCKIPDFGSGDLQKGQKTRGYLTFEIPKNNKPAQLTFIEGLFSSDQVTVSLQ